MIMTSYFARYHGDNIVNIARFPPDWYEGRSYPLLFPPAKELHKYKYHIITQEEFEEAYKNKILSRLDPFRVAADLEGNVVCCHEAEGEFCHRRLVADWIYASTGIYVPEFAESFCEYHGKVHTDGVICKLNGKTCPFLKRGAERCREYHKPITYDQMSLMDFLKQ